MVFPVPTDIKATLKLVKELLDNGKFKPIIDRHYPMEKIAEAFTYVNSGQKTGSVILNL
jgi:NADPH:quinone reductase-like Zn-dependent oxidoreductase